MPDFAESEIVGIASIGLIVVAGAVLWTRARRKKKPTPEELEATRRRWLAKFGKLSGGEIVELNENSISYCYDVRGMNYTASQDISALGAYLPPDYWTVIGGVGVRFDPRNPANSIVLCETWTGLRKREPSAS